MKLKTVHITYFAVLRERAGLREERVETSASALEDLYTELRDRHGFPLPADRVRFAEGNAYIPGSAPLTDGMRLTLIPPVAGG